MKKLILSLILLVGLVFSTAAQTQLADGSYALKSFEVETVKNGVKNTFKRTIDVSFNPTIKRCIVYTADLQIIDYQVSRTYTDTQGYYYMEGLGTDTKYNPIELTIVISPSKNLMAIDIFYIKDGISFCYYCHVL